MSGSNNAPVRKIRPLKGGQTKAQVPELLPVDIGIQRRGARESIKAALKLVFAQLPAKNPFSKDATLVDSIEDHAWHSMLPHDGTFNRYQYEIKSTLLDLRCMSENRKPVSGRYSKEEDLENWVRMKTDGDKHDPSCESSKVPSKMPAPQTTVPSSSTAPSTSMSSSNVAAPSQQPSSQTTLTPSSTAPSTSTPSSEVATLSQTSSSAPSTSTPSSVLAAHPQSSSSSGPAASSTRKTLPARKPKVTIDTSEFLPPVYEPPSAEQLRLKALTSFEHQQERENNRAFLKSSLSRLVNMISAPQDMQLKRMDVDHFAMVLEAEAWNNCVTDGSYDVEEYNTIYTNIKDDLDEWEIYWDSDECGNTGYEDFRDAFMQKSGRFIKEKAPVAESSASKAPVADDSRLSADDEDLYDLAGGNDSVHSAASDDGDYNYYASGGEDQSGDDDDAASYHGSDVYSDTFLEDAEGDDDSIYGDDQNDVSSQGAAAQPNAQPTTTSTTAPTAAFTTAPAAAPAAAPTAAPTQESNVNNISVNNQNGILFQGATAQSNAQSTTAPAGDNTVNNSNGNHVVNGVNNSSNAAEPEPAEDMEIATADEIQAGPAGLPYPQQSYSNPSGSQSSSQIAPPSQTPTATTQDNDDIMDVDEAEREYYAQSSNQDTQFAAQTGQRFPGLFSQDDVEMEEAEEQQVASQAPANDNTTAASDPDAELDEPVEDKPSQEPVTSSPELVKARDEEATKGPAGAPTGGIFSADLFKAPEMQQESFKIPASLSFQFADTANLGQLKKEAGGIQTPLALRPSPQPVQEEVAVSQPVQEQFTVAEPAQEEMAAPKPVQEELATREPVHDQVVSLQPMQEHSAEPSGVAPPLAEDAEDAAVHSGSAEEAATEPEEHRDPLMDRADSAAARAKLIMDDHAAKYQDLLARSQAIQEMLEKMQQSGLAQNQQQLVGLASGLINDVDTFGLVTEQQVVEQLAGTSGMATVPEEVPAVDGEAASGMATAPEEAETVEPAGTSGMATVPEEVQDPEKVMGELLESLSSFSFDDKKEEVKADEKAKTADEPEPSQKIEYNELMARLGEFETDFYRHGLVDVGPGIIREGEVLIGDYRRLKDEQATETVLSELRVLLTGSSVILRKKQIFRTWEYLEDAYDDISRTFLASQWARYVDPSVSFTEKYQIRTGFEANLSGKVKLHKKFFGRAQELLRYHSEALRCRFGVEVDESLEDSFNNLKHDHEILGLEMPDLPRSVYDGEEL